MSSRSEMVPLRPLRASTEMIVHGLHRAPAGHLAQMSRHRPFNSDTSVLL
jgi:hypothetical protein